MSKRQKRYLHIGVAVLDVSCRHLVLGNVRERDEGIIKRKPERKKKKIPPRARRREKALQIRSSASVAASDHTEEKNFVDGSDGSAWTQARIWGKEGRVNVRPVHPGYKGYKGCKGGWRNAGQYQVP